MSRIMVRAGTQADYQDMLPLGQRFADYSHYKGTVDPAHICMAFERSRQAGLLGVAFSDAKLVGGLIGVSVPQWYDPTMLIAVELAWWVDPQYRNTRAGLLLLNQYEEQARATGHRYCAMMTLEGLDSELLSLLYERRGFHLTERSFMKVL